MRTADIKPGVQIGTLKVIAKTHRTLSSGRRMPAWSLKCECGKIVVAMTVNLMKGKHMSCGCQKAEIMARTKGSLGVTKMPEYRVYRQMLDRCYLTTAPNYRWYGAKGVEVCDRWRNGEDGRDGFLCFLADMGPRPDGLTLERDNPFEDYGPDNCRWATWAEQGKNHRRHYEARAAA